MKRALSIAEVQHPAWYSGIRSPAGRPLCRRCLGECTGKRRTFCSAACVEWWRIRRSPAYLRRLVRLRDKGICRSCYVNTYEIRREANRFVGAARAAYLRAVGFPANRSTYWDMDHVLPIAEGGDPFSLDNLQSLCVRCHKRKTAEQAARRACANRPT